MHPRVAKVVESASIQVQIHRHADCVTEINSPVDFAAALGYQLCRITKTLYVRCSSGSRRAMVVCPMDRKVDMFAIAASLGCSRIQIARPSELQLEVGFPPGSVSPLGVDPIPVLMEESLLSMPTILIGAGESGVELELAPYDLRVLTKAHVAMFAI